MKCTRYSSEVELMHVQKAELVYTTINTAPRYFDTLKRTTAMRPVVVKAIPVRVRS